MEGDPQVVVLGQRQDDGPVPLVLEGIKVDQDVAGNLVVESNRGGRNVGRHLYAGITLGAPDIDESAI